MKENKIIVLTSLLFLFLNIDILFGNKFLAKINNSIITVDDFKSKYKYYIKNKYSYSDINSFKKNSKEIEKCLNDMINDKLILNEAIRLKYHLKKRIIDLIALYKQQIIINAYIEEKVGDKVHVTEEEIDMFYEKNSNQFQSLTKNKAKEKIKIHLMTDGYMLKLNDLLKKLKKKVTIKINEKAFKVNSQDKWVFKIGNTIITTHDFNTRYSFYLESNYPEKENSMSLINNVELKKKCLQDMINEKIVIKEAIKLKFDKKNEVKKLISLYKEQIIVSKYLEKHIDKKIKVSEKEIKDFYKNNQNQYKEHEYKTVKHEIIKKIKDQKADIISDKIANKLKKNARIEINKDILLNVFK